MRTRVLAAIGLAAAAVGLTLACSSPEWEGEVVQAGTFDAVLFDGDASARVRLARIAETDDTDAEQQLGELVAVGALEGLAGEVTIVDGTVWITRVRDGRPVTEQGRGIGGRAAMLASARVNEWSEHAVTEDVAPGDLGDRLKAAAVSAGIEAGRPFPFRVEGTLLALDAHVIAGDCPMRARRNGVEPDPAPVVVAEDVVDGSLVGMFAEGHEGTLTHHGTRMHVHVLTQGDHPLTAHVEHVGLRAGGTLFLPAR